MLKMAVVDPQLNALRVCGFKNFRVIDASIRVKVVSTNLNVASIMIKGADLIKFLNQ